MIIFTIYDHNTYWFLDLFLSYIFYIKIYF